MGPHYLSDFFQPKSVAIIGASERADSVGCHLLNNLRSAGYRGRVYPVNDKHATINGRPVYAAIGDIDETIDLVVIATPAQTIPSLLKQCADQGIRSVVICSSFQRPGIDAEALQQQLLALVRQTGMRIMGPNCYGLARPANYFNLTYGYDEIKNGGLALLSQSGAVCSAIIDWARSQDIGFSTVVSIGDAEDIDFGEVLDFLSIDSRTRSIVMYVESVHNARRFLSGLKAAASLKPIVLIKAGRYQSSAQAVMSHTGRTVGSGDVFDAAIARAGVVRVNSIAQLFSAARILAHNYSLVDSRLAIITNAGGPGVMCADQAEEAGIQIAELSAFTVARLKQSLPETCRLDNPLNLQGDASAEHFRMALQACLADTKVDGVLNIVTPQALTEPTQIAAAVIDEAAISSKPVLASWTGGEKVQPGRALFACSKVAHFNTPEAAVDAFSFLAQYRRNQILLKQIPLPSAQQPEPDIDSVYRIIDEAQRQGRQQLSVYESKQILAAFHIPVNQTAVTKTIGEALQVSGQFQFPLALKIDIPEVRHKTDIGGVRLNVNNVQELAVQYAELSALLATRYPHLEQIKINLESMVQSASARELMVGMVTDPVFGPAVSLGMGGTLVEILQDKVVALPPLNQYMIEQMIAGSKAGRYLCRFRHLPAANSQALVEVLLNLSTLVSEIPEVIELEMNPLIVDEGGAVAVDAQIRIQAQKQPRSYSHMAIHPYPLELTWHYQLANGVRICIRPIRPEDAVLEQDFVKRLSERSRYFRFMQSIQELTPEMVVRFTQIDYDREMAFVVVTEDDRMPNELGVGRYMINPDAYSAEFAIVVSDDCQGFGIGVKIMSALIDAARTKGLRQLEGEVLTVNKAMLSLAKKLGFRIQPIEDDYAVVRVIKDL
ncbi:bifunctional acetate--CoA ligase family protein/GNAT family N-acetyltransferase [Methylomarinum sp. Ch1-1]|uniref:Bifunctional acetate--CoA ligase family protein/GNAT family N-acetyltransferase n=1 Tax=Methylomarinum roseum TaxID=3067653 RepID=A0AAU7NUN2_9GAMM|nr:bifunctional acetate--CoA ligase family protein/GNAT family N-acetyltransferase [Methylomarinum sp. Ch1-1]MDP4519616.1 bifunctional acetate--CoA ligase family protein/GNAT family N-acetyltransferase [Methylomarinum sp. Ch1-1]